MNKIQNSDLEHYREYGWVWLKNIIPDRHIQIVRKHGQQLATWIHENNLYGAPAIASEFHWQGVGCASKYRPELFSIYTSAEMYDVARTVLETNDVYIFNDQTVYKMPFHEGFNFLAHTDNSRGPNTDNRIHTVNCCVILDDFTPENGALEVMLPNKEFYTIYGKAGDIVCIRGDCVHRSSENRSGKPRGLYACVYADEGIDYHGFYNEKFPVYK